MDARNVRACVADPAAKVVRLVDLIQIRSTRIEALDLGDGFPLRRGDGHKDTGGNGEDFARLHPIGAKNALHGILHAVDFRAVAQKQIAHVCCSADKVIVVHALAP